MFSEKFIKATEVFCTYEKPVNAPYLRKVFTLDAVPAKASVTLTCTGFYRVFINGHDITASRLAPGIVNPDDTLFFDTYDLVPYLTAGKNVLGFMLGNGMSNSMGGFIWDFEKARFRSAPKLSVSFESDALSFEADESFKCAPSPIYFDDLRSGEFYDARLEQDGWNTPDFDDSTWTAAIPTDTPRGDFIASDTDPIVVTKELAPETIIEGKARPVIGVPGIRPEVPVISATAFYQPEDGMSGYIFAFPENAACVPRLRIKGKKGQVITIQCAEMLEGNEIIFETIQHFYPYGFCQRDIYICRGEGVEEYVPSFTYHGARYMLVNGLEPDQVSDDTLTMLVTNSDLKERGGFACSDGVANRLQRACRMSDLANFVYFPTDCPHREKNGWTGDASVSAEHMMQNITPERSWRQWLRMIARSQKDDGRIPGIVPTSGWGFAWGNGPAWDQVMVELPYQAYKYQGNLSLFEVVADTVMRYLNYVDRRRDKNGLLAIGLGDWCHAMRGGDNFVCPLEVSDTAIVINMARKAEIMYRALGMNIQADFAASVGHSMRESFRAHLIDFDTFTVAGECQCAQAAALYYGIFEKGETAPAYARLLELIHEKDDHFDCGMIGVRVLFRVLGAHGDGALAYKMITRTDAPSYGIWTEKFGYISMLEVFGGDKYSSGSINHHFMGDISGFFIAHIAGLQINPDGNDPSCVRICPTFVDTLDNAEAFYDTVKGRVTVRWEREDGKIIIRTERADGVHGKIVLPKGYMIENIAGGDTWRIRGRHEYALENGAVYTVVPTK